MTGLLARLTAAPAACSWSTPFESERHHATRSDKTMETQKRPPDKHRQLPRGDLPVDTWPIFARCLRSRPVELHHCDSLHSSPLWDPAAASRGEACPGWWGGGGLPAIGAPRSATPSRLLYCRVSRTVALWRRMGLLIVRDLVVNARWLRVRGSTGC